MSVSACVLKDFLHRVSCTCNHIVKKLNPWFRLELICHYVFIHQSAVYH